MSQNDTPADGDSSTVSYEHEGTVVFHDRDNPLAWIQAERPIDLGDCR